MKIKRFFSPNHDRKMRSKRPIKMIIIHYTGMQSERESLKRLCDPKSKVSCHYFINKNGNIFRLVEDRNVAWHAGKSCWHRYKNLNKNSIGIELSNKGHQFGYTDFTKKQIVQLISLSKMLIKKYKISKKNIVGHSDVAPSRKLDPGEKFPWQLLSRKKVGLWHNLNPQLLMKFRKVKIEKREDKLRFIKYLNKVGYCFKKREKSGYFKIIKAFQRHYRKDLINGLIDLESLLIAKNLSQKL